MKRLIRHSFLTLVVATLCTVAGGQTTAFTYQGNLSTGGVPANGSHDFQFLLFSAASGGSQIGIGTGVNNVVVNNGVFNVLVNFGNQFPGAERWLEIRVRPASQGSFTTLTPRQIIASSPYSVKSINSELLGGVLANQYVLTTDSRLTDLRAPSPGSANYIQNRTTQQAASSFNISGSGTVGGSLNVQEASTFQKSVGIVTTLNVGEAASVGGGLTVGGTANVTGAVNTANQFNIGGSFALGRSRLDLFNTLATPRGFSFEVLNSPSFFVLKNDSGNAIMTFASDGKVGIGDNNPLQATLEIGGTIAVSNLGGSDGDQLCRDGNLIRACIAVPASSARFGSSAQIERLEATIGSQQVQIDKQRSEVEELKQIVCSIAPAAAICLPKK